MNKFLEKNKKLLLLISMICLGVALLGNLVSSCIGIFGSFANMFDRFGVFLTRIISISSNLLALLGAACYVGAAFFMWKKNDHMKLLGISGLISVVVMFLGILGYIVSSITYDYFNFGTLVSEFFACILPFVFAAYLVVFSVIKVKGPVIPIVGAALVLLVGGSSLTGNFVAFIRNVVNMFNFFHPSMLISLFINLVTSFVNMASSVGLLLLVPLAFYAPKDDVTEAEIVEEAAEVASEEIPAAE